MENTDANVTRKNVNDNAKNTGKDINNEKVRIFRQKEILIDCDCGTKKMLLLLSVLV